MSESESAPHILVVDDDRRLRELLRRFLTEQGFRVTTAQDAAAARAHLRSFDFDILVVDVMMPGENGRTFTASVRRERSIPILLLTAMAEPADRIAGLESGADDYLAKPFEPRELVLRLQAILRRAPRAAPSRPLKLGVCVFDPERGELRRAGHLVRLTSAEEALLRALAAAPGRPFARDQLGLAAKLQGQTRAIDVQVARLRRKIEPDPKTPRYLRTVWGEGYVLVPD